VFVTDGGPFVSQADKKRDVDDPGARDAHQHVHRRRAQEGWSVMAMMDRRQLLQALASGAAGGGRP
jgi:hypothetical protein